jgi:hypothetical protein
MKGLLIWYLMSALSLTACAQSSEPSAQAHEAVEMMPEKIPPAAESIVNKEKTEEKKERSNMNHEDKAEPVRGPAIPAAEFKKRLLDLIGSLEKQEDTNQANVEMKMGNQLLEDENSGGRFSMRGNITEGWSYWYFVRKEDSELGSAITFFLYHDEKLPEDEFDPLPKTCTFSFDEMAKELIAKGFKKNTDGFSNLGGKRSAGFRKIISFEEDLGFSVRLFVYTADNGTEDGMLCIDKITIN